MARSVTFFAVAVVVAFAFAHSECEQQTHETYL
jgi:hypothetical protein